MAALAIDGGTPLRSSPYPAWPALTERHAQAAADVVRSGRLNYWTGQQGRLFEAEYAHATGRAHAIAVANGTVALELALRAFGIGPGDEVVVPARTFIATASCVVAVGATPVVADVDFDSGNVTAETVEAALTPRTKAVIPVHVGGWPVDMDPLVDLAARRSLVVVEDCAQAHGAAYRTRPVGALGSHAATFSFCQDKIVSVGDGGMLVLDDEDAFERAWSYKEHGKSLAKVRQSASGPGGTAFVWLVDDFGTNWRLDEMSAAVGRVGLELLPEWHTARVESASRLAALLRDVPGLRVPLPPPGIEHGFYRLYAYVEPSSLAQGWTRDRLIAAIAAEGVPCQYGTCAEIYREAVFASHGLGPARPLPGAARLHETQLAFLVHPGVTAADVDDVAAVARKVMEVAAG